MQSLLDLAIAAVAAGLHHPGTLRDGLLQGLPRIPEPELAERVWELYQRRILDGAVPWARHFQVVLALAAFWQPPRLQLGRLPDEGHTLSYLPSVGQQLQHLELSAPQLRALDPLAACPRLRCLSLRGCRGLADGALAALATCTALQAVDLAGLAQLTDAAAAHIARLPSLAHLNCSGTAFTDKTLEALTYGQRVAAWARQAGQPPPPDLAAAWPPLPLRVLRAAGCCGLTAAGLQHLCDLPSMLLLDVRRTHMPRAALQPLQQRFGLQLLQGCVLSSSNALAAAVVNQDAPACACHPQGAPTAMDEWAVRQAQLLLRACPSRGVEGFLEPGMAQPAQLGSSTAAAYEGGLASPAGAAGEAAQALRRQGYRIPRGGRNRTRIEGGQQQGPSGGSTAPLAQAQRLAADGPRPVPFAASSPHVPTRTWDGQQASQALAPGPPRGSPNSMPGWGLARHPYWLPQPPPPHYDQYGCYPGPSQQQPYWGGPPPGLPHHVGHPWGQQQQQWQG